MKKILIATAMLVITGIASADGVESGGMGYAGSGSVSGTGASTSALGYGLSGNGIGPGYAFQGSFAGASNTTAAGAGVSGSGSDIDLVSGVASAGSTYSYSEGVQGGFGYGETSGLSYQGGMGSAGAEGSVDDYSADYDDGSYNMGLGYGGAEVSSFAVQVSGSATTNVDNGSAGAVSEGIAISGNTASLGIDASPTHVDVEHDVDSVAVAGGGGDTAVSGGGTAIAGGFGFAEGDASTYAVTWTNGDYYNDDYDGDDEGEDDDNEGGWPGYGYGDNNHDHDGPPGLN